MSRPTAIHEGLATGRWRELSLAEQLGNVGSEVGRAARAKRRGDGGRMWSALERSLELLDLTISDPSAHGRRKELCRAREVVCDFFVGENAYGSTTESLDAYFMHFALAARLHR